MGRGAGFDFGGSGRRIGRGSWVGGGGQVRKDKWGIDWSICYLCNAGVLLDLSGQLLVGRGRLFDTDFQVDNFSCCDLS